MRSVTGLAMALALGACSKPAPQPAPDVQAPSAPQVRIGEVGGTRFAPTVGGSGAVVARAIAALPGRAPPTVPGAAAPASSYSLIVALPAADALRVKLGVSAQVRFAAFENDVVVGRVVRFAAPLRGSIAVEIALPPDPRLHGGEVGTARITATGVPTTVLAVPPSAVVGPHSGAATVYVVDLAAARVHRRAVTLGAQDPDGIRVTAGLRQGEWVALTRPDQLHDGMKIVPIGPQS